MFTAAIWGGLWALALGLAMNLLVLRWWPGDRLLAVRLLNYGMPWLLVLLLPALALAAAMGQRWLALALALPTVYILVIYLPLFLPVDRAIDKGQPPLRVMSYNVWSRNQDLPAVARVIQGEQPDLLLVQELTPARVAKLRALLSDRFPLRDEHFAYDQHGLLAAFSRYPLRPQPVRDDRTLQKLLVETPEGPVTVYNVHLLRTVLRRRDTWLQLDRLVAGLLTEEVATAGDAVIMGGDFNLTDQTQTYRQIRGYLRNAHWEAGRGFGFSYPSPARKLKGTLSLPAMVRIDHLFYGDALEAIRAGTLPESGGSDHLPIYAEFVRRKK